MLTHKELKERALERGAVRAEYDRLEGAQAGLSWLTILRKREHYRRAFAGFEIAPVAAWLESDIRRLLADPGIVRNRLKVASAIANARAVLGTSGNSARWPLSSGATSTTPPGRTPGGTSRRCRPGPHDGNHTAVHVIASFDLLLEEKRYTNSIR